jgi:hypothetical protein
MERRQREFKWSGEKNRREVGKEDRRFIREYL